MKDNGKFILLTESQERDRIMEEKKELRYGARHKGDIIVTTILNKEKTTTKRVRNTVKIVASIVKDKI